MRKGILISACLLSFAIICFFSCDRSEKDISTPVFLKDAPNLANQTGGFYSKAGQVDISETNQAGERMLLLTLHDATIRPYQVKLYVEKQSRVPDISSGNYEVLFLGSALILNEPATGQKFEFTVSNDNFKSMEDKLPGGYISSDAIKTIGIAVVKNIPFN